MTPNIEIKLVNSWPENEIVKLYKSAGWWKENYDSSQIQSLIKGSYAFAIIVDKKTGKAIGMGRIISDGISDAYIQDLVILKEYRDLGIGKQLVKFLIDFCKSKGLIWIGLIAEPNQDEFYKQLGFKPMDKYVPMKYEKDE
jgi:ribosomal protein S18 acetylase RimI-like enzyme